MDIQRCSIVSMLLGMEANGSLQKGSLTEVAEKFQTSRPTVSRLWGQAKLSRSESKLVEKEVLSKKTTRGRKKKWDDEAIKEAIKEIPWKKRRTMRGLSKELGIPLSTLQSRKKQVFFRHTSSLKPALTDDQRITRIEYCLWNHENNGECYSDMLDRVHVDEKWFFMQSDGKYFLLAPDEEIGRAHV